MSTTISTTPEEYRALREGCGLADRSCDGAPGDPRRRPPPLPQRLRHLRRQEPRPGRGGLRLRHHPPGAHPLRPGGDWRWRTASGCCSRRARRRRSAKHLRKYILADRVEVLPLEDMLPVTLIGPRAAEALGDAELPPPGDWRHVRSRVHGTEVALQRSGRLGAEAYTLWVSASIAGPLIEGLLEDPGGASGGLRGAGGAAHRGGNPALRPGLRPGELPAGDRRRGAR